MREFTSSGKQLVLTKDPADQRKKHFKELLSTTQSLVKQIDGGPCFVKDLECSGEITLFYHLRIRYSSNRKLGPTVRNPGFWRNSKVSHRSWNRGPVSIVTIML